jgi:hypothetical protein
MAISETPVTLPLGRDILLTKPVATGSPPDSVATIGMVVVAFLAAMAAGQLKVRITSTLLATRSLASCGSFSQRSPLARSSSFTLRSGT